MLYISKERRARLAEVLGELKEGRQQTFVMRFLGRDVIYANDAYQIMRPFVDILSNGRLYGDTYSAQLGLLKLVSSADEKEYYWLYRDAYSGFRYLVSLTTLPHRQHDSLKLRIMSAKSFKEGHYKTVRASNITMFDNLFGLSGLTPFLGVFRYTGKDLEPVKMCIKIVGRQKTILKFERNARPTARDLYDEYMHFMYKNTDFEQWNYC